MVKLAAKLTANRGVKMVTTGISGVRLTEKRWLYILGLSASMALSACVSPADAERSVTRTDSPPMGWDHRPEAESWTTATLLAVSSKDADLAQSVPNDIAAWCPGYASAAITERRMFWAGLLSKVAKYESSWNPAAAGGGGRYIGLMQISPRTAGNNGCAATSANALKDGAANLQCAVIIMSQQVARDGVVAGSGNRGAGRDWMPFRDRAKRAEIAAWTASQPYCTKRVASAVKPRPSRS